MNRFTVDRETPEYRAYLEALEHLQQLKEDGSGQLGTPSEYWMEELAGFDYMLDASPLLIAKLRHHCYHITGLRVYDYRTGKKPKQLADRLRDLESVGSPGLFVDESRALGGFGYEVDGRFYNLDTVKYYEVLVGLDRAGFLEPFRSGDQRRVAWEIGAGWGGFAYQFKRLFPNTTYIISDLPELFLFSYTYLRTVFPEARVALCGAGQDPAEVLERWQEYDFVFVPNTMTASITGVPLDLTVNMVSFQEMTGEQVAEYVNKSADLGCPHLYSLNRDRSVYNDQISSVRRIIRERYRVRDNAVLALDYVSSDKGKKQPTKSTGYQHAAGTLREARQRSGGTRPEQPAVAIGMVVSEEARLEEAIQCWRGQTEEDFLLLVLDDATSDGSAEILARHAAEDRRIIVERSGQRLGSVGARRVLLEKVRRDFPTVEFFAWASDRDRWDEQWLEAMVAELRAQPRAVLAYPGSVGIDGEGRLAKHARTKAFDTTGYSELRKRFGRVCHKLSDPARRAYGLFRIAALEQVGGLQPVSEPERLLLLELALLGEFRQYPDVLWYERTGERPESAKTAGGAAHQQFARSFVNRHVKSRSPLGLGRLAALRLALTLYRTQKRAGLPAGSAG